MRDGRCVINLKEQVYLFEKGHYGKNHHILGKGWTYPSLRDLANEIKDLNDK